MHRGIYEIPPFQLVVIHCWWCIFVNFIYYLLTCRITNSWQGHCNSTCVNYCRPIIFLHVSPWYIHHTTGDYMYFSYYLRTVRGFFNILQNLYSTVYVQGLWDRAHGLLMSLSKKPRKSMHFTDVFTKAAPSAQLWKTLSVGLAGVRTNGIPLSSA